MYFYDTETCGFHGPIVLLQWAKGLEGAVTLHPVWKSSISSTMELIENMMDDEVVGFNMAYDHFHLCQTHSILSLIPTSKWDDPPEIQEYAMLEPKGRNGLCLKPKKACDLMIHARRGPYQSTMNRGDIRIRKVPTALAWQLADELEARIPLKDIYFARKKDKSARRWSIANIEGKDGRIDPNFKDLVLSFAPSSALKALAADALELDEVITYSDIELPKSAFPTELGYAPFALAIGRPENWNNTWPDKIREHIFHWSYDQRARKYAELDVIYLQKLYSYFGCPELGDDDSELTCMIAAARWRGYAIDIEGLKKLSAETDKRKWKELSPEQAKGKMFVQSIPEKPGWKKMQVPTSPSTAKAYITEVLSVTEKMVFGDSDHNINESTGRAVLEKMAGSKMWLEPCKDCAGKDCTNCAGQGVIQHEAAKRAKEVLQARQADYEKDFYDKLIEAGRFHASSSVIGALSGRMSGGGSARGIEGGGRAKGDKLNPQGVKRAKEVRGQFPLADGDLKLCGGDFSSFEVALAEAVYKDKELRRLLLSGKQIHAIFGTFLFPHLTYDQIVESKGKLVDYYNDSKRGFFAVIYGGNAHTLNDRIGIPIEVAEEALRMFEEKFEGVKQHRLKIKDMFCSMRQPGGIGSEVEWHEPCDYIEAGFGFRRYFTLENSICKSLFDLATDPPKEWLKINLKVVRRDRMQTASGALRSALFAGAFALQASNMRAAANHEIQSYGAMITKRVQRKIWDLQPSGVHKWLVQPLNVHDEIQCPTHPSVMEKVAAVVNETVASIRPQVPLIKMDWNTNLNSWADKS
jgi:hypothetical protein